MKRTLRSLKRSVSYLGILAMAIGVAAPAEADPEEKTIRPEASAAATPPELIQSQAKHLGRQARVLRDEDSNVSWRGSDSPRLGVVDGKAFRDTLNRIGQLAVECDRQIATKRAYGEPDSDAARTAACLASLREIENEVFGLEANATRIWSPVSNGRYSYLVDMSRLESLAGRLGRLAEGCAATAKEPCSCDRSATDPAPIEVAHVNTSIDW